MFKNAKRINLESFPRKEHFRYFTDIAYPYVGCTVNVDITKFLSEIKEIKRPFFLSFLYYIVNAANRVPEMRQRIYEGGIIEFDSCRSSHTVARKDGTYCYCKLDCNMPIDNFLPYAMEAHNDAKTYGNIEEGDEALSLFFLSSLPWLSYTSLIQPVPSPADSNPRISWGKYFEQNGRILIPVSILCNHALVDGIHLGEFYEELERCLNNG